MKIKITSWLLLIALFVQFESCGSSSSNNEEGPGSIGKSNINLDCSVEDGNHSASIDYYNPNTGHQATYDLDVEVVDCEVTQINFNNGGWLDDSHFNPTELDSDGSCEIEDDRGRQYTVHIED